MNEDEVEHGNYQIKDFDFDYACAMYAALLYHNHHYLSLLQFKVLTVFSLSSIRIATHKLNQYLEII